MFKKIIKYLRDLKEWIESFAEKSYAMLALFIVAFTESSFFPVPPDVLLIAIAISSPKVSFKAAFWCTVGSVAGALLGYYIGYALFEVIGKPIIDFYGYQDAWNKVVEIYRGEVGMWFLATAAFSPIPYKVSTIAAGATGMNLIPFVVISTFGRAGRFFLVAALIYLFGPKVKGFIDKYFDKLSIAFLILLIGGFIIIKYIF